MKKILVSLAGLSLLGVGCIADTARQASVPYAAPMAASDVATPVIPYQPELDPNYNAPESEATPEPKPMAKTLAFPGKLPDSEIKGKLVDIQTVKGLIEVKLFGDEGPLAASNFVYLAKTGFYDGLTFHRREEGFVIQGGDPIGDGTGGPGYKFEDEPVKRAYSRGILAMANAGANTNGSQFFIMLGDTGLPPKYTIFGQVVKGMDVVDKIEVGDVMTKVVVK